MTPLRRPAGLLLASGGSLGSWQSGFVTRLAAEAGWDFDRVLGASTGALTAAAYALDRLDVLAGLWWDISRARVLRWRPRLRPPTMFSNASLYEIAAHGGDDESARRRARVPFAVMVTERGTGRRRVARYERDGLWDGPLADHLVASCSIPDVFPPVAIRAERWQGEFVDGAKRGEAPDFSYLAGCRDVVVVEMFRPEERGRFPGWNPVRWREHPVRLAQLDFVERGLASLRALPEPPRLFRVRPSSVLDFSLIAFRTGVCAPAFRQGEADAEAFSADPLLHLDRGPLPQEGSEMLFSPSYDSPSGETNGQVQED